MNKTSEKLFGFRKPMLFNAALGTPLGFAFALIGIRANEWFLGIVLKDNFVGLLTFGVYYVVLGIAGIAVSMKCCETAKLEKLIDVLSIPNRMSLISGVLLGISIAAICKGSGIDALFFLTFSILFGVLAWVVKYYENEVLGKIKDGKNMQFRLWLAPISALLIGCVALAMAWCKTCSCGV
ncbi:MAG: hypothetical protein PXX73_02790 [Sideroxydans sp.]|nr:hypothetical protein [Sideroxydans sp.]